MGCGKLFIISRNFYTPNLLRASPEDLFALVVSGNKIDGIGNLHDLRSKICATTKIIKAEKNAVLPGFIDAHTHMLDMGWRANWIDLSNIKRLKDLFYLLEKVADNSKGGEWILGHSWDESLWEDEKRYPTLKELDEISQEHPIYLRRVDGHIAITNTKALKLLKIPEDVPIVEKDDKGKLTGVLKEKALEIAEKQLKKLYKDFERALDYAFSKSIEKGITSVTDYLTPLQLASITNYLAKRPHLYRITSYIWMEYFDEISQFDMKVMHGSSYIRFNGVKIMVDGSIGARTAALRDPYRDDPTNRGTLLFNENELDTVIKKAEKLGYQLSIHAIGDRAIDVAISALKKAKKIEELRHRIEHFEVVKEEHIQLVRKYKISLSMQPNFVANWQQPGGLYERRLGWERARDMNPFRTLIESGIIVGFGSDCMPFDPLYGIYGAVTHPKEEERLTIAEAIKAYTLGSAYLEGSEKIKGKLEAGKLADIVILDRPLDNAHPRELLTTKVKFTIIGGHVHMNS